MSLQDFYLIGELVVGIAVIISIVFIAIELRQNTYMMRKTMADQRETRLNWFHEEMIINNEFRHFQQRMSKNFDQLNENDRQRAFFLGVRTLRPALNELVAYFDGQISNAEFKNLNWNLKVTKSRPQMAAAYNWLKNGYPENVQKFWEDLDIKDHGGYNVIPRELDGE